MSFCKLLQIPNYYLKQRGRFDKIKDRFFIILEEIEGKS